MERYVSNFIVQLLELKVLWVLTSTGGLPSLQFGRLALCRFGCFTVFLQCGRISVGKVSLVR